MSAPHESSPFALSDLDATEDIAALVDQTINLPVPETTLAANALEAATLDAAADAAAADAANNATDRAADSGARAQRARYSENEEASNGEPESSSVVDEQKEAAEARSRLVCGYNKIRDLGAGTFGKAILVECNETRRQSVMKAIDVTKMSNKQRKAAVNEVRLLGALRHPFIIGFQEAFLVHGFLCIITDFADAGDLATEIKARIAANKAFCEHEIISIMTQLTMALRYLHKQHILHRDIKTSNIFMTSQGRALLGDFGIAKALDATSAVANTIIGTPYYLSPEVYGKFPYSWASDIWALGCVLYELCTLKVPFEASNMTELTAKVLRSEPPRIPDRYSPYLHQLYAAMMRKNPNARPGTYQIINRSIIRFHAADMIGHTRRYRNRGLETVPFPRVTNDSYCSCGANRSMAQFFNFSIQGSVIPNIDVYIAASQAEVTGILRRREEARRAEEINRHFDELEQEHSEPVACEYPTLANAPKNGLWRPGPSAHVIPQTRAQRYRVEPLQVGVGQPHTYLLNTAGYGDWQQQ